MTDIPRKRGLLAVDVDGTLLTDHGSITADVHDALERAHDAGWEVVIATGRTLHAARDIIARLPFVEHAVLSNGACIVNMQTGEIVSMESLSPELAGTVIELCRKNGAIPALYDTDLVNQTVVYDTLEGACEYFEWYVDHDSRCSRVDDVLEHVGDVLQIGMIAPREIVWAIRNALAGKPLAVMALPFENPHFGGKNHDFWFLQVLHEEAAKINSLRRLAAHLGRDGSPIVAVGDNYNDIDMIAGATVGIAMGNAPDEVKRLAGRVVGTNNDSGLREVVDSVLLSADYFPQPD